MARLSIFTTVIVLLTQPGVALAGDPQRGASIFQARCSMCHSAVRNGPPNFGPNLFGIVGRKPGIVPSFEYSGAMRATGTPWSVDRIEAYVEDPAKVIPGVRMSDTGVHDADARHDLVAYLATLK